jgi:hypothetical protein
MQISGNAIEVRSHLWRPPRSIGMSHVLVRHLPQPQASVLADCFNDIAWKSQDWYNNASFGTRIITHTAIENRIDVL